MGIDFHYGKPGRNGDYVVLIQDRTAPEWVRPIILHWHDGLWYYAKSNNEFTAGVFGWLGPLPVGRLDDPHPPSVPEFDL